MLLKQGGTMASRSGKGGRRMGRGEHTPPSKPRGEGGEDEFTRLANMLEAIREMLQMLVNLEPPVVDSNLQILFSNNWARVEITFLSARLALHDETQRSRLRPLVEGAGFTGSMLKMKEYSLIYQMNLMRKAILTYSNKETPLEKLVKWIKPGFKVMNSIMGSLLSVFPGLDIAKEFKEHVEAGYEVVETAQS
jgi:hypothetical protein